MFLQSSHDVGSSGLLVVLRAAAGGVTGMSGVPFFNIEAAGVTVIFIFPAPKCSGQLVSADPVWVSLIDSRGCRGGRDVCSGWRGFLERGLVTSGRRCTG